MSQTAVLFFILVKITAIYCSPITPEADFKVVEMHPNCRNMTYCSERGLDYPIKEIEELVKRTDITTIDSAIPEQRQTSHSIVTPCQTEDSMKPIYQVRDIHNDVRYVVQDPHLEQIVEVQPCKNIGEIIYKPEYLNTELLKLEYRSAYCEESYTTYRFVVLSKDRKSLESVAVKGIPVCCRCMIRDIA